MKESSPCWRKQYESASKAANWMIATDLEFERRSRDSELGTKSTPAINVSVERAEMHTHLSNIGNVPVLPGDGMVKIKKCSPGLKRPSQPAPPARGRISAYKTSADDTWTTKSRQHWQAERSLCLRVSPSTSVASRASQSGRYACAEAAS